MQLVFDTYIAGLLAQVAAQRDKLERYAASLEEQVAERTKQFLELSRHDVLTGLANQTAFFEHMRRELSAALRTGRPLLLIFADINEFKSINDSMGHIASDRLLEKVAAIIKDSVRLADIPCRYRGDEFCVILPNTRAEEAEHAATRITEGLRKAMGAEVTLSIGIAQSSTDRMVTAEELVKAADAAMYEAKKHARRQRALGLAASAHSTAPLGSKPAEEGTRAQAEEEGDGAESERRQGPAAESVRRLSTAHGVRQTHPG